MQYLSKETLFWIPFAVDRLLCCVQFPMFALKGADWMQGMFGGGKEGKVTPAFGQLYDTFVLCYAGYCAMMFYSCYTILAHPGLLPTFGAVMLGVNVHKMFLVERWKRRTIATDLQKSKDSSLKFFNLPCYGGYCLLCFWHWYILLRSKGRSACMVYRDRLYQLEICFDIPATRL